MIYGPYEYWQQALADPKALHAREFKITTEPQEGFYRTYNMKLPVAIFRDESMTVILVNSEKVREADHETIWLSCAKHPVSEAAYHTVTEGGVWPDLDEAVAAIGHNRKAGDPESIIDDLAEQAKTYEAIEDDATAQKAISLRAAILEQHKRADKARAEEKEPYLRRAQEVDQRLMPAVKKAKAAADRLRDLVAGWETSKRMRAREAEAAAQIAANVALANQLPAIQPGPPPLDQIRTGYGHAAAVRTRMVVKGIRDWNLALSSYHGDGRLEAALLAIAQKDIDAGQQPAGFVIEEEAFIR
jgi:hypothetical protein